MGSNRRTGHGQDAEGTAKRSRRPWIKVLGLVVLAALTAAALRAGWPRDRALPLPRPAGAIDPFVTELIDEHAARIASAPDDAEAHGLLGLLYEANGFWPEARQCYADARSLDPGEVLWSYHLAIAQRQAGDAAGALALLRDQALAHPDFAPLLDQLGLALLETGETDEAADAFERVIELEPRRPEGYAGLGEVELRRGDHAAAAELLERAVEIDPSHRAAHYLLGTAYRGLGRQEEAARELGKGMNALARYMPDALTARKQRYSVSVPGRLDDADTLLEYGRPREAAAILEEVLAVRPDDVRVLNSLAAAYIRSDRPQSAYPLLLQADRLDAAGHLTPMNLAACCLALNRPREALAHARRAVERGPSVGKARIVQAVALAQLQQYPEALESLHAAARLDARNPQIHAAMGEVCHRMRRFDEARRHFVDAVELMPDSAQAHAGLCLTSMELGDLETARAELAEVARLVPDDPGTRALRERLEQMTP